MESREIVLTTRTPIWTGGAEGTMDRIHETGILGSLRWWYEALVRGVGGRACDPSSPTCLYDAERPSDGICDVCRLFGATGWRRRFRLSVDTTLDEEGTAGWPAQNSQGQWQFSVPRADGRATSVYLRRGHRGSLTLRVLAPKAELDLLDDLLRIIARHGGLGARTQVGFGVVSMDTGHASAGQLLQSLSRIATASNTGGPDLPNARRMFFAHLRLGTDDKMLSGAEGIREMVRQKAALRALFRPSPSQPDVETAARHSLFGTVKGQRVGSKVNVSRPYAADDGWEIRVWGWAPESVELNVVRTLSAAEMIDRIHEHLSAVAAGDGNLDWRQASLPADTKQVRQFVDELLR